MKQSDYNKKSGYGYFCGEGGTSGWVFCQGSLGNQRDIYRYKRIFITRITSLDCGGQEVSSSVMCKLKNQERMV